MGGSSTIIILLIGLFVLSGVTLKLARDRLHRRLDALRAKLGLTETVWEEKGLMSLLTGRKGSTQLALASRPWGPLQVRATIPASLPLGLSLTPQGSGSSLRGMQDIQVGIPDLDSHFQVQGEHPAAAIRFLREEQTQGALRSLVSADPKAAVTHGEVRLTVANLETPGELERTVQLANRIAQELAVATGAPVLPEPTPETAPAPALEGSARAQQVPSPPLRSSSNEPFVTAELVNGLIHPRFSPGYLAGIQRQYNFRRLLLRCWYLAGAGWATVLILDRYFQTEFLFSFPRRHPVWTYIMLPSLLLFFGLRALLRRCPSCGSSIGEGYGVTRVVNQHPITCTNCSIELQ